MEIYLVIAFLGACLGSFITAASYRLPRDEDIVFDKSRCPSCKNVLGPRDLVPIFSWIISGRKCRHCKAKISARYIATEISMALLSVGLLHRYGLGSEFLVFWLLSVMLMITIISDLETYIMPDSTTIGAFILGVSFLYYKEAENIAGWEDALYGCGAGLVCALLLRYGYQAIKKKEGLGMGDVKFLPVAGLWVGLSLLPAFFILAGLLGVLTAILWKILFKNPVFPFGPALAVAMFILCVFKDTVLNFLPL